MENQQKADKSAGRQDYYRKYYAENREKILEQQRQYYNEHLDRIRAYQKKYHAEHHEKELQQRREYYQRHKEKCLEYMRQYRANPENREKNQAYQREYYEKNRKKPQSIEMLEYEEFPTVYTLSWLYDIRAIFHNGELWYLYKDAARICGFKWKSSKYRLVNNDELRRVRLKLKRIPYTGSRYKPSTRANNYIVVNTIGFYRLILNSSRYLSENDRKMIEKEVEEYDARRRTETETNVRT